MNSTIAAVALAACKREERWNILLMKTRIITSVVGLAVLALVLCFFNTVFFDLVISAICFLAFHEAFKAFGFTTKEWYVYLPFVPFTLLLMLSKSLSLDSWLLPAAFLFGLYICVCVIRFHRTLDVTKLGGFVFFSSIVLLCFYSLIHLKRLLPVEEFNYDAIFFILLTLCFAWGGDSAAYFAGRFLGKHKLAPEVSPKKTVEGAIGGVLGSVVLGLIAMAIYAPLSQRVSAFTAAKGSAMLYLVIAVMAAISSVLGILGDLFASAVKRQVGIKDYGTIFPGHGGILDRFDSVMFVAPFVTIVVTMVFYHFQH